jgi:hypothetical protein
MAGINRTTGKATDLITFSRASRGTALRKISYGPELVTNGGFDTDTNWTKGTGWTIGSGVATHSGLAGYLTQDILTVGKVYKISFDIVSLTNPATDFVQPYLNNNPALSLFNSIGRHSVVGVALSGPLGFAMRGAGDITIDNISVKEVLFDQPDGTLTLFNHPNNIPRIEYAADGTVKGLLIEEQRVNYAKWSEDFTQSAWLHFDADISPPEDGGPYGLKKSVVTKKPTSSSIGAFYQSFSGTPSGTYTASGYYKGIAGEVIRIGFYHPTDGFSYKVHTLTGDWDYVSITSGPSGIQYVYLLDHRFGATANQVEVSYLQVEAGSFPTSYISTSSLAATRAPDLASISVDNFGYRQDAGTVVVKQSTFDDVKNAVVWQIDDGTANNRYVFNAFNGNTSVIDGGVSQASLTHTGQDVNVTYKHGFGYKLNSFASVYDGGGPVTDVTGTLPTVSTLRFGSDTSTNAILNGHIKSISYYPRRLSNSQIQILTGFAPVITGLPTIGVS